VRMTARPSAQIFSISCIAGGYLVERKKGYST
jgi:hypothetical protein